MKKMILTLALGLFITAGATAQECCSSAKGDWYVGTGDIANTAWTEWSLSPTIGYAFTNDLVIGLNVSQADSTEDVVLDLHARYFFKGYFAYAATEGFDTDGLQLGVGKMFAFHKNSMFIDPKVVYDTAAKTTNLQLGFGLKF